MELEKTFNVLSLLGENPTKKKYIKLFKKDGSKRDNKPKVNKNKPTEIKSDKLTSKEQSESPEEFHDSDYSSGYYSDDCIGPQIYYDSESGFYYSGIGCWECKDRGCKYCD